MRLITDRNGPPVDRKAMSGARRRIGVVDGALAGDGQFASLSAFFPQADFEIAAPDWHQRKSHLDLVIIGLSAAEAEPALRWLRGLSADTKVILVLRDADVTTSRQLLHGGAADVLPAPVSEAALALSIERILTTPVSESLGGGSEGRIVALLKAGGGVGVTSLGMQAAAILAGSQPVCFADLDVQFGAGAVYFDLPDALTVTDCLAAGAAVVDTPFATALATHRSGARLLAAPKEVVALDSVTPIHVEALLRGLRRDVGLTLVDLPQAWTAWTYQALQAADQIVLVTHLTVPHIQQVKRQLRMLAAQRLEGSPLTLVCNAVSSEQLSSLPLKAAERALGRPFDVVIPEDGRTMATAINQGIELSAVRRGTKLEKAVRTLSQQISATAPVAAGRR